tara:strand:- start:1124 stop:1354 length:231 start_codon:yes stop_codon:yes gene_type:complete
MSVLLKKILFMITLNSTLLLMLIVGIQNSSNKRKVNLLIGETVNLPISFIIGMSFIAGSLSGSLILNIFSLQKDSN